MKFVEGDDVKLINQKSYSDGVVIQPGTEGIVEKAYPLSSSYLVKFDGVAKSRRVLEGDLKKV